MVITKIEQQKKNKRRYSVFVDGDFALGIHESILFSANFNVGDSITEEQLSEYQYEDELFRAKEAAFHLLKYRQRSKSEMHQRLKQKKFSESVVETTITELEAKKYLNDTDFARQFAQDQLVRKNIGPLRLRAELNKKQVPEKIINSVIDEIYKEHDVYELAASAAEKKLTTMRNDDRESKYRKITGYLARRGFSWDVINNVLDKKLH